MQKIEAIFKKLDIDLTPYLGDQIQSISPIDGGVLAKLRSDTNSQVTDKISAAHRAFLKWRDVPAPKRGELIRLFSEQLRKYKATLAELVTLEAGKIVQEGLGEVQEMIDICDFAVGLSRQLYGLTIASERPGHRMMEQWHPIGVIGVISAFNFPVAVWAWNASLAFVCGNSVVWKPSEKTPLTAIAVYSLLKKTIAEFNDDIPQELAQLLMGTSEVGTAMVDDSRIPVISATGSTKMGREVAQRCALRLARTILELGGNNAMIVAPSADLEMALRSITFSAVGTAGQRCTSLRRLFVHNDIYDTLIPRLKKVYAGLTIGNPLASSTLVGPLINAHAFEIMQNALDIAKSQQGIICGGERVSISNCKDGYYVRPALVEMSSQTSLMHQETFAPILYVLRYTDLAQVIALHNDVPQGLSSSIFTSDIREAEQFISGSGSDCGIANVNIGPSGAEIGGAFGGEKETGGGRESGSDAWKAYMRRATNTINYSHALPLAQGIQFDVEE